MRLLVEWKGQKMALDKSKLKSYMEQVAEDSAYPDYDEEDEESFESEGEEEAEEELEEEEHEAGGDYESFMEMLYQNADAIQQAASSVFVTALDEIEEDAKMAVIEAIEQLPDDLVHGIKQHLGQLDPDELHDLIENLEESGAIENDASVVPFLYWVARLG